MKGKKDVRMRKIMIWSNCFSSKWARLTIYLANPFKTDDDDDVFI